jgi:hypothetical protein
LHCVVACPVSIQERLRGWRCRSRLFGCRPYIGSRVRLTGGRWAHNSRRGGVLSPHPPTLLVMVMPCPRWRWGRRGWPHRADGDGSDRSRRPDVTVLSLRGCGIVVCLPFEGSAILFRGCGAPSVRERVAQCHGVVAGHAAQRRTVEGMTSPGELAEQFRGVSTKRIVVWIRL